MPTAQTPRVLIIVGDASETVDTLYPLYRLQEAGFAPVVAAPELRTYQMVMHEVRPGWTITREWEGYQIQADVTFADVGDHLLDDPWMEGNGVRLAIAADARVGGELDENPVEAAEVRRRILDDEGPRVADLHGLSGSCVWCVDSIQDVPRGAGCREGGGMLV